MATTRMQVRLPPGLANFANLFKPRAIRGAEDKGRYYSLVVAWPKATAKGLVVQERVLTEDGKSKAGRMLPLMDAVREVAEKAWPGEGAAVVEEMKHPVLRDGDRKHAWGLAGKLYLQAKRHEQNPAPDVYDQHRRRILSEEARDRVTEAGGDVSRLNPGMADEEAYSGCMVVAVVTLFSYKHPTGGRGVGIGLDGMQVWRKGPRIGGGTRTGEDSFEEAGEGEGEKQQKREPWE